MRQHTDRCIAFFACFALIAFTTISGSKAHASEADGPQRVTECGPGMPCFIAAEVDRERELLSRYYYFLPDDYDASQEYPLLILLHGAGCGGLDNCVRNITQTRALVEKTRSEYPAVLFVPQLAERPYSLHNEGDLTLSIAAALVDELSIDPDRIYLTGSSMGGFGTATYLAELYEGVPVPTLPPPFIEPPQRIVAGALSSAEEAVAEASMEPRLQIAAAAPMEGAYIASPDPAYIDYLRDTPIWIGHGDADTAVSPDLSRDFFRAITGLPDSEPIPFDENFVVGGGPTARIGNTYYSEVPGGPHGIKDGFYNDDVFLDWMFAQSLSVPEPTAFASTLAAVLGAACSPLAGSRNRRAS